MRRQLAAGIAALGLLSGLPLAAQEPVDAEPPRKLDELETVLVIGEHPGPGLWKVRKGENVMWVLASYEPLPRGMTWRAREVEAHIGESQEVLLPPLVEIDPGIGFLGMLTLIPAALKAVNIPDDKTLRDVLPPATWQKWNLLRGKYMGGGRGVDRMRPMFAIDRLRDEALGRNQLTNGPSVDAIVRAAAKKSKVPMRRLPAVERTMSMKTDDLRDLLKNVRNAGFEDIECFTQSLDSLEPDIGQLKLRANAWSRGNIDALRDLHNQPEMGSECEDDFGLMAMAGDPASAARLKKLEADYNWLEEQAGVQAQLDWIAAARKALEKNRVTFTVLPVGDVVRSDGHLEKLRALGYEIEEP